jgi:adenosine kinase
MSTLICGSIAYDSIMVFKGRFADHILPHQVHILNVSFLVPEMRREFGGCAGNIAYNLKLLGGEPLPMATVGNDAQPYLERFESLGIPPPRAAGGRQLHRAGVHHHRSGRQPDHRVPPGRDEHSHLNCGAGRRIGPLAIVAPDGRDGMLQHAQQLSDHGIPFMFDPGQGCRCFPARNCCGSSSGRTTWQSTTTRASCCASAPGSRSNELARKVEGAHRHARRERFRDSRRMATLITIPAAPARCVIDPTGCGDAYRAGLLYGISGRHGLGSRPGGWPR